MKAKRLFLLLMALLVFPAIARAQEAQTEIVFDASRSMNEMLQGKVKLDEAKKALSTVVGQISPDSNVGLRIFGKNPVQNNVRESCLDSRLVVPIQPFNKQIMLDEVVGIAANGQTALGYSLKLAGQDFSPAPEVKKTIILISDGEESCGMDPVNVIGDFKARGINFVVHAIGFAADAKTQAQLKQITNMTGGTYQDAQNAGELVKSIQKVAVQENIIEKPVAPVTTTVMDAGTPKKEEPAAPPAPEELLLRAGRETGENLLAATAGTKIITATNEELAYMIDGAEDAIALSEGDSAVFTFKDQQAVLLESFAIPVLEENGGNVGELVLSGSVSDPNAGFFPIAKIQPQNKVDFKNINQRFKIEPPVAIKYLKIQSGKSADGANTAWSREWKVYGKYLSESELAEKLKGQKARERNLLAKEAGGRLIASSDPSFDRLIDASGEQAGDSAFLEADQEAVFGFNGDKTALISAIEIPIFQASQYNCRTFEFYVSETSPADNFSPVGTFKTQNMAIAGNTYQAFKFPAPVKAKYLKMKLIDGHDGSSCELAEVRVSGIFEEESGGVTPAAATSAPAEAVAAPVAETKVEAPVEERKQENPAKEEKPAASDDFYKDFKTAGES